jgi:hypothetical protein
MTGARLWPVLVLGLVALGGTAAAQGAPTWALVPLEARGVDAATVETFTGLLRSELGQRLGTPVALIRVPHCADAGCAVPAARDVGAAIVAWGDVSVLGAKVIVSLSVARTGASPGTTVHREAVMRIEDLDAAAVRLARAVTATASPVAASPYARVDGPPGARPAPLPPPPPLGGPPPVPPPPPGAVGEAPAAPPMRPIQGVLGAGLHVGAIVPLGRGYAGNPGGGLDLGLSYWFEAQAFAIEARVGVRFDAVEASASYAEVPLDFGIFYLLSTGDFVPFIGGGVGYHYLWEKKVRTVTVGAVLPATTEIVAEGDGWGAAVYARAGLLLGRTHGGRIALAVEYDAILATINGFRSPQAVMLGATLIF